VTGTVEVDARGLSCPIPLVRTRVALRARPGAITVLVTDPAARDDVAQLLAAHGYHVAIRRLPGELHLVATRTG
jgi:TusA-related sulfurtransferase